MIDGPSLHDFYDLRIVFISAVWVSIVTLCISALHRRRRTYHAAPLLYHFVSHIAMAAEILAIIYAASDGSSSTPSAIEDPDAVRMSKTLQWLQRCTVLVWLVAARWMFLFVPRSVVAFSIVLPVVSEWCRVSLQLLSDDDIAPAQLSVDCIVVVCGMLSFCSVIGWQWLFVSDVELLFRQIPATPPDGLQDGFSDGDSHGHGAAPRESHIRFTDTLPLDNALSVEGAEEDMKSFWLPNGSVGWSLWLRYKTTLIVLGVVRIAFDALALLPAWLLRVLVDTLSDVESSTAENVRVSAVVIAVLVMSAIVGTLMRAHYNLTLQRIALSNRGLLSDCITRHTLRTRSARLYNEGKAERRSISQGDIINHMTVDAQRVSDGLGGLYDLWALPLQTCLTLYLLYVQVSFAFVAGIAITLALIPVNMFLAKKISRVNTSMLAFNDERVLCINEVMNNIIYVKMCGWSPLMAEWIRVPRERYMKCLRWVKMLDAMCVFFWATTPVFVSLSTFALYIAIGGDLTPGRAVAALSLFNALILPLNAYPWVINGTVEAYVSLQRLQNFLGAFVRKENACIVALQARRAPPALWPCPSASDGSNSSDDCSSDEYEASSHSGTKNDEKKSFLRHKFRTSRRRHAPGAAGVNGGEDDGVADDGGSRERSIPSIFSSGTKSRRGVVDESSPARLAEVTDVLVSLQHTRYAHVFHRCGPEREKRETQVTFAVDDRAFEEDASDAARPFSLAVPRFTAKQRELITIVGSAGSGKSTFLAGVAGETWRLDGGGQQSVSRASVAYVEQTPFLFSGSIKANILCGLPYRKDLFEHVMRSCALDVDMREFHDRENTQLGDRGSGLSGGQKFRVALARALYADKKLYIIDDCLGSLDAEVANHIVDHVYAALPREDKGVVVATHNFDLIARSHRTYVAANNTLRPLTTQERDAYLECSAPVSSAARASGSPVAALDDPAAPDGHNSKGTSLDEAAADALEQLSGGNALGGGGSGCVVQVAVQLSDASAGNHRALTGSIVSGTQGNEVTASGSISFASIKYYMSHVGYIMALVVVVFIVAMQAARNVGDWLIAVWVSDANASPSVLLQTLGILAAVNAALAMVRGVSFAVAGLTAARTIHHELLDAILGASYHFFMKTSPGRIINRLSRDVYNIDDSLPFTVNILLAQLFLLVGSVVIVIVNSSWIVTTLLIPVALANYSVQRPYRRVSREVKRLESAARSPLIDDLRRILEGGAVLRAFGANTMTYYHKRARANLTLFLRANANLIVLQAWFGIRLQLIGCLVLGFVGVIAVYYHNAERAAALGLALAYVAPLTSYVSGVLSSFVDTEKQFVSVERVVEYLTSESEAQSLHLVTSSSKADDAPRRLHIHGSVWPLFGTIQFNDVSMRYDTDGPLILRNVTFQVDAGEKVAVVGRTGAGKTSLFVALLRLLRLQKGSIMIDSEDIQRIEPEQLRQRLAVFPQEPFLFHGTVRKNVDPFGKATDDEVAAVLRRVQLFHLSPTFVVQEGGKNLSTGQRYLVALARVALQQSCILLLDEPSAKIDRAADAQLWTQIDTLFRDCTVLTITHNLDHIDWFDRVIVLDRGVIIGCGTPSDLRREGLGPFGVL